MNRTGAPPASSGGRRRRSSRAALPAIYEDQPSPREVEHRQQSVLPDLRCVVPPSIELTHRRLRPQTTWRSPVPADGRRCHPVPPGVIDQASRILTRSSRRIVLSGTLVSRLRARDEEAFRELYDEAWDGLLAIAAAIVQSRDLAEDVVQGVMFRIWQRGDALDPQTNLADYLVTAVRNASLSALRDDARLRQRHDGLAAETVMRERRGDKPAAQQRSNGRRGCSSSGACSRRSEHQRTAFTMRYALEMTNQQIADTLEISLKGAEQLTARLNGCSREVPATHVGYRAARGVSASNTSSEP